MTPLKKVIDQEYTHILPANYQVNTSVIIKRQLRLKEEKRLQKIENLKLFLFIVVSLVIIYLIDYQKYSFNIEISKSFYQKYSVNIIGVMLLIGFGISELKNFNKKTQ